MSFNFANVNVFIFCSLLNTFFVQPKKLYEILQYWDFENINSRQHVFNVLVFYCNLIMAQPDRLVFDSFPNRLKVNSYLSADGKTKCIKAIDPDYKHSFVDYCKIVAYNFSKNIKFKFYILKNTYIVVDPRKEVVYKNAKPVHTLSLEMFATADKVRNHQVAKELTANADLDVVSGSDYKSSEVTKAHECKGTNTINLDVVAVNPEVNYTKQNIFQTSRVGLCYIIHDLDCLFYFLNLNSEILNFYKIVPIGDNLGPLNKKTKFSLFKGYVSDDFYRLHKELAEERNNFLEFNKVLKMDANDLYDEAHKDFVDNNAFAYNNGLADVSSDSRLFHYVRELYGSEPIKQILEVNRRLCRKVVLDMNKQGKILSIGEAYYIISQNNFHKIRSLIINGIDNDIMRMFKVWKHHITSPNFKKIYPIQHGFDTFKIESKEFLYILPPMSLEFKSISENFYFSVDFDGLDEKDTEDKSKESCTSFDLIGARCFANPLLSTIEYADYLINNPSPGTHSWHCGKANFLDLKTFHNKNLLLVFGKVHIIKFLYVLDNHSRVYKEFGCLLDESISIKKADKVALLNKFQQRVNSIPGGREFVQSLRKAVYKEIFNIRCHDIGSGASRPAEEKRLHYEKESLKREVARMEKLNDKDVTTKSQSVDSESSESLKKIKQVDGSSKGVPCLNFRQLRESYMIEFEYILKNSRLVTDFFIKYMRYIWIAGYFERMRIYFGYTYKFVDVYSIVSVKPDPTPKEGEKEKVLVYYETKEYRKSVAIVNKVNEVKSDLVYALAMVGDVKCQHCVFCTDTVNTHELRCCVCKNIFSHGLCRTCVGMREELVGLLTARIKVYNDIILQELEKQEHQKKFSEYNTIGSGRQVILNHRDRLSKAGNSFLYDFYEPFSQLTGGPKKFKTAKRFLSSAKHMRVIGDDKWYYKKNPGKYKFFPSLYANVKYFWECMRFIPYEFAANRDKNDLYYIVLYMAISNRKLNTLKYISDRYDLNLYKDATSHTRNNYNGVRSYYNCPETYETLGDKRVESNTKIIAKLKANNINRAKYLRAFRTDSYSEFLMTSKEFCMLMQIMCPTVNRLDFNYGNILVNAPNDLGMCYPSLKWWDSNPMVDEKQKIVISKTEGDTILLNANILFKDKNEKWFYTQHMNPELLSEYKLFRKQVEIRKRNEERLFKGFLNEYEKHNSGRKLVVIFVCCNKVGERDCRIPIIINCINGKFVYDNLDKNMFRDFDYKFMHYQKVETNYTACINYTLEFCKQSKYLVNYINPLKLGLMLSPILYKYINEEFLDWDSFGLEVTGFFWEYDKTEFAKFSELCFYFKFFGVKLDLQTYKKIYDKIPSLKLPNGFLSQYAEEYEYLNYGLGDTLSSTKIRFINRVLNGATVVVRKDPKYANINVKELYDTNSRYYSADVVIESLKMLSHYNVDGRDLQHYILYVTTIFTGFVLFTKIIETNKEELPELHKVNTQNFVNHLKENEEFKVIFNRDAAIRKKFLAWVKSEKELDKGKVPFTSLYCFYLVLPGCFRFIYYSTDFYKKFTESFNLNGSYVAAYYDATDDIMTKKVLSCVFKYRHKVDINSGKIREFLYINTLVISMTANTIDAFRMLLYFCNAFGNIRDHLLENKVQINEYKSFEEAYDLLRSIDICCTTSIEDLVQCIRAVYYLLGDPDDLLDEFDDNAFQTLEFYIKFIELFRECRRRDYILHNDVVDSGLDYKHFQSYDFEIYRFLLLCHFEEAQGEEFFEVHVKLGGNIDSPFWLEFFGKELLFNTFSKNAYDFYHNKRSIVVDKFTAKSENITWIYDYQRVTPWVARGVRNNYYFIDKMYHFETANKNNFFQLNRHNTQFTISTRPPFFVLLKIDLRKVHDLFLHYFFSFNKCLFDCGCDSNVILKLFSTSSAPFYTKIVTKLSEKVSDVEFSKNISLRQVFGANRFFSANRGSYVGFSYYSNSFHYAEFNMKLLYFLLPHFRLLLIEGYDVYIVPYKWLKDKKIKNISFHTNTVEKFCHRYLNNTATSAISSMRTIEGNAVSGLQLPKYHKDRAGDYNSYVYHKRFNLFYHAYNKVHLQSYKHLRDDLYDDSSVYNFRECLNPGKFPVFIGNLFFRTNSSSFVVFLRKGRAIAPDNINPLHIFSVPVQKLNTAAHLVVFVPEGTEAKVAIEPSRKLYGSWNVRSRKYKLRNGEIPVLRHVQKPKSIKQRLVLEFNYIEKYDPNVASYYNKVPFKLKAFDIVESQFFFLSGLRFSNLSFIMHKTSEYFVDGYSSKYALVKNIKYGVHPFFYINGVLPQTVGRVLVLILAYTSDKKVLNLGYEAFIESTCRKNLLIDVNLKLYSRILSYSGLFCVIKDSGCFVTVPLSYLVVSRGRFNNFTIFELLNFGYRYSWWAFGANTFFWIKLMEVVPNALYDGLFATPKVQLHAYTNLYTVLLPSVLYNISVFVGSSLLMPSLKFSIKLLNQVVIKINLINYGWLWTTRETDADNYASVKWSQRETWGKHLSILDKCRPESMPPGFLTSCDLCKRPPFGFNINCNSCNPGASSFGNNSQSDKCYK